MLYLWIEKSGICESVKDLRNAGFEVERGEGAKVKFIPVRKLKILTNYESQKLELQMNKPEEEIERIADRVTIMRDGENVGTFEMGAITKDDIIKKIAKEQQIIINNLVETNPKLVLVALGAPKQELFIDYIKGGACACSSTTYDSRRRLER